MLANVIKIALNGYRMPNFFKTVRLFKVVFLNMSQLDKLLFAKTSKNTKIWSNCPNVAKTSQKKVFLTNIETSAHAWEKTPRFLKLNHFY